MMLKRRKILFLSPDLGSGGSERMFVRIANYCIRNGFDVRVALLDTNNPHYKLDNDIEVIDLNVKYIKYSIIPVMKLIHRIKPDIVFTSLTAMNVITVMGTFLFQDVKFVARESTIVSINNKNSKYPHILDLIINWFYPRFSKIVAQSNAMKNDLEFNFGIKQEKIIQIYNPVEDIKLVSVRKSHNVPVFVTVGNLRKEKGYQRMIELLSEINFNFVYYIVGDGEMKEELIQLIESKGMTGKIVLAGRQANPFIYLQQADLYLMSSFYEGFPNAVLEAGIAGLPVIAYKAPGGISEIILEDNGILVQDGNAEAFRTAIASALKRDWDRTKIRIDTLDRFNYDVIMEKYVNLFQHV